MDSQTRTLKDAMVMQGARIGRLQETFTKAHKETTKKFDIVNERIDEVAKSGEKNTAALAERLRKLEVGERPTGGAEVGRDAGEARRPRRLICGGWTPNRPRDEVCAAVEGWMQTLPPDLTPACWPPSTQRTGA